MNPKHRPLLLLLLLLLLALAGCKTTNVYNGDEIPSQTTAGPTYWGSGYAVVNNTEFYLDIVQDGREIAQRLAPGRVLPLRALWLQRISTLTVIGRREDSSYVGTDSYMFSSTVAETWTVTALVPKGGRW